MTETRGRDLECAIAEILAHRTAPMGDLGSPRGTPGTDPSRQDRRGETPQACRGECLLGRPCHHLGCGGIGTQPQPAADRDCGPDPCGSWPHSPPQCRTLHHNALTRRYFPVPDHYAEERRGDGNWNGKVVLCLSSPIETARMCGMLNGASVEIGFAYSPITASNPRVDATNPRRSRTGEHGGGRV